MGKSTISMAIFNSYVKLPEGKHLTWGFFTWFNHLSERFFTDLTLKFWYCKKGSGDHLFICFIFSSKWRKWWWTIAWNGSSQSGSVCQSHSLRRLLLQFKQLILHLEKLHSMFFSVYGGLKPTKVVDQPQWVSWGYHPMLRGLRRGYVPQASWACCTSVSQNRGTLKSTKVKLLSAETAVGLGYHPIYCSTWLWLILEV